MAKFGLDKDGIKRFFSLHVEKIVLGVVVVLLLLFVYRGYSLEGLASDKRPDKLKEEAARAQTYISSPDVVEEIVERGRERGVVSVANHNTGQQIVITGEPAEALAMHARLRRLEYGRQRGFGSVKVAARIEDTEWRTSVFPQKQSTEWVLLVSRKVMRAEGLADGEPVALTLALL